jgi:hypothetical protein
VTLQNTTATNVTTTPYDAGWTGVEFLGRAGIRWFIVPGFSLDPAFVFGFTLIDGSAHYPANVPANATVSYDSNISGFSVGLSLAVSGWVGMQ